RNVGAAARHVAVELAPLVGQLHPGIGERAFPQGPFALVVLIELDRQQLDQRILDPHGSLLPGGDGTISRRLRCYRQGGTALLYARPSRIGRIAQLVEQLTLNQRVAGSSPAAPTIKSLVASICYGAFSFETAPTSDVWRVPQKSAVFRRFSGFPFFPWHMQGTWCSCFRPNSPCINFRYSRP